MAFLATDNFVVDRAGTPYRATAAEFRTYIEDNIGSIFIAADITARDALTGLTVGDTVHVTDASADAAITTGFARYMATTVNGSGQGTAWELLVAGEDIGSVGADLAYTAAAGNGVVTSSTGTNATITAVDGTNAGLMLPADKTKVDFITVTQAVDLDTIETDVAASKTKTDFITVTQAVDLDAIETNSDASKVITDFITVTGAVNLDTLNTNSHVAATTAGAATTNPVTITAGQVIDFDIAGLAALP